MGGGEREGRERGGWGRGERRQGERRVRRRGERGQGERRVGGGGANHLRLVLSCFHSDNPLSSL